MKILTWNNDTKEGMVSNGTVKSSIVVKPELAFLYDHLLYEEGMNDVDITDGIRCQLSEINLRSIDDFIASFNFDDPLGYGIDTKGKYLGIVQRSLCADFVDAPPDAANTSVYFGGEWHQLIGVSLTGKFIPSATWDNADVALSASIPPPPASDVVTWNGTKWQMEITHNSTTYVIDWDSSKNVWIPITY